MSKTCRFPFCLVGIFLCALAVSVEFPGSAALSHAGIARQEAESWTTVISGHSVLPSYKIVVDKSRQQLSLLERHSPLRLSRVFLVSTGQAVGDKEVEGDLKTPEGVYFVVHRIASGLEFRRFGHEAYTLNYPNPVDRLRRKTGHGIWIHGRGEPLTPLQTEGCVAMDNDEIALLGKILTPGTPVLLTESFSLVQEKNEEQAAIANELHQKVKDWTAAWSARSAAYFDFYDKEAYSIAQRAPFSDFQANKERLFKILPWIRTTASSIQVLEGPGYWVTWFYQDYQAPNLKTRGVRRLYWARDNEEFKIVGMEWLPGLSTASTLVASSGPLLPPLETPFPVVMPDGWIVADADTPGSYGAAAAAEGRLPARVTASASPDLTDTSSPVGEIPEYLALTPEPPAIFVADTEADRVLLVAQSNEDTPPSVPAENAAAEVPPSDEELASQVITVVESWRLAWEKGDLEAYMAYYTPRATQGSRRNAEAVRIQKEALWKRLRPASVLLEDMRVSVKGDTAQVVMRQRYTDEKGNGDIGRKTLSLILRDGAWLITQEDWSALPHEISN